jgi:hypothetical protein
MSVTTGSDVLAFGSMKERYSEDKIFQEFHQNSLTEFIRKADAEEVKFDAKVFNIATLMTLPFSYKAITDNEALPLAGKFHEVFAKYNAKLMYSSFEATHYAATRGHAGGRVGPKYMDDLMRNTLIAMELNIDFDLYGNGRGYRATIESATPGSNSMVLKKGSRIMANMILDVYDSSYTTLRGTIMIDTRSVDRMTKTAYINSGFGAGAVPAGVVPGDVLVISGALAAGEPTDGRYMAGLDYITDNSVALGQLSPLNWSQWQAVNQNAALGNPTQEMFQAQFDLMREISGMYPTKGIIPPSQKRNYMNSFWGQRQFTSNSYDTGMSSISFDAVKMGEDKDNKKPGSFRWLEDKNCDNDRIYFWQDECLCIASDKYSEPTIADEDGAEIRKRIGFDTEEGFYRYWANTVSKQRNGIGKIFNLAINSSAL